MTLKKPRLSFAPTIDGRSSGLRIIRPQIYRPGELWGVKGLRSKRIGSHMIKAVVEIKAPLVFGSSVEVITSNIDVSRLPDLSAKVFMSCWKEKRLLSDKEARKWKVLKRL